MGPRGKPVPAAAYYQRAMGSFSVAKHDHVWLGFVTVHLPDPSLTSRVKHSETAPGRRGREPSTAGLKTSAHSSVAAVGSSALD